MTARTTQPRPSKGPLGERGRRLQERLGVVPLAAITRRGVVPERLRASWSCLAAAAKAAGQPANCRRHEGWSRSPSPRTRQGTRSLIGARFQPDWGKPNVRLIGGREETGASRLCRAARGASCLPDVQPITASIQRVRVPPWESSDCPGSHIRRARGATLGRESPEVQVPGGPTPRGRGRLVQGREQSLGPQHQANRCSYVTVDHQEPPFGGAQRQLWEFGSAEPVRTGRRPASAGKKSDICTRGARRRRGGGTKERIDVSKWGRSAAQPRPDRMAKTRRITAEREVAERAADWRLRPYER